MKQLYTLLLTTLFLASLSSYAANRRTNGTGGGNWTDASTWACNCIPSSTDDIILEATDTLTVDTTVTCEEFRYEYSDDGSRLVINNTRTLTTTSDFIIEEPNSSDASANIVIDGTLHVGNASDDDFRIFGELNEDNLTINLTINSTGVLEIDGGLTHTNYSGSPTNIVNITSTGSIDITGNITSSIAATDCQFNLDIDGNFDAGAISVTFSAANGTFSGMYRGSADVDITSYSLTFNGSGATCTNTLLTGADLNSTGVHNIDMNSAGDDATITWDIDGTYRCSRFSSKIDGDNDTVTVVVRDDGTMTSNTKSEWRYGNSSDMLFDFDVENGGEYRSVTFTSFALGSSCTYDLDNAGTMVSTVSYLSLTSGITLSGTIDNAATGSMTYTNHTYDLGTTSGSLTFNNDGALTANGNFSLKAGASDVITMNWNETPSISSQYQSETSGTGSTVTTNVSDSLVIGELQMDVLSGASSALNTLDFDNSGAVVSLTSIDMDVGSDATIVSGNANNSTMIFRGSTATDIPIRSTVDYDNIIVNNTTGLTLDEGNLDNTNFTGNMTILSGATLTLNSTHSMAVDDNFSNSGTFNDNGSDLTVGGDLTNTSTYNNDGSDITVTGDFSNSGTFSCASTSNVLQADSFINTGTFEAQIDSLVLSGNFRNDGSGLFDTSTVNTTIYVEGDWINNGTYRTKVGDSVVFRGGSAQNIRGDATMYTMHLDNSSGATIGSGGSLSIENFLGLDAGTLTTNGNLTLLSSASGTAAVGDLTGGGSVSGDVNVQRFLNEGNGWYLIGSPVQAGNATIAEWNDSIPMSGFTGTEDATSSFVSVYTYDESTRGSGGSIDSGYVEATNVTNDLGNSVGHFVYIAAGTSNGGTSTLPATIQVSGPLNTGSVGTGSLSFTGQGASADRGWHMRANPYASPVEWSQVTRTNLQNSSTAYVMGSDGNYDDVINDNIDYIYSGEAFWIQVASGGGSLTFDQGDKVRLDDDYNARQAPDNRFTLPLQMELTYTSAPGYMDYSTLVMATEDQSTVGLDDNNEIDSKKISNALGYYANISSFDSSDNLDIYYNGLSKLDSSMVIPLRVWKRFPANRTESFKITFNGIEDWVAHNKCVILEDRDKNKFVKLGLNDNYYKFDMYDTVTQPRIYLHYTMPLEVASTNVTCFGYNDGTATVMGDGSGTHDYTWFDEANNLLQKETDVTGPNTIENLSPGTYTVWVSDNGDCGTVGATVVITEPDPIIADFSSDNDTIFLNSNSTIYFTNSSFNATEYFWDFGDGATSNEENPSHTYTDGGTFSVMMVAIDGVCSDTVHKTIEVVNNVGIEELLASDELVKIFQQYDRTFVEFNFDSPVNATILMHDVLGKSVIAPMNISEATKQRVELNTPEHLFGIYTISVIAGEQTFSKKIYYAQ